MQRRKRPLITGKFAFLPSFFGVPLCDVCITCEDDAGSPRDRPDGRFLLDTQVTRWTNGCLPRARLFTDVISVNSAYLHLTETLSNPILTLLDNKIIYKKREIYRNKITAICYQI